MSVGRKEVLDLLPVLQETKNIIICNGKFNRNQPEKFPTAEVTRDFYTIITKMIRGIRESCKRKSFVSKFSPSLGKMVRFSGARPEYYILIVGYTFLTILLYAYSYSFYYY